MKLVNSYKGKRVYRAVNIGDFCYNISELEPFERGVFKGKSLILIADPVRFSSTDGVATITDLVHSNMKIEVSTDELIDSFKPKLEENGIYGLATLVYNHQNRNVAFLIANRHA